MANMNHMGENRELGKVWLVGAGPGAGELLTLKARRLLKEGDCIVYDRLVGDEVLSMIPSDKEIIGVGKSAGRHATPQEEINRILIREAKLGKRVVRLKGGDPFLLGEAERRRRPCAGSRFLSRLYLGFHPLLPCLLTTGFR